MRPYYQDESATLYHGDCREIIPALDVHPDCAIADPPYGETSLQWDRWPDGWPGFVAATGTRALWCFGSLRMFLGHSSEFAEWKLSQDVVWQKPRARGAAADRFARAHELAAFWYRGEWSTIYKAPQLEPYHGKPVRVPGGTSSTSQVYAGYGQIAPYLDNGTRMVQSVLAGTAGDPRRLLHPTQKPVEILQRLIDYACPPAGLVLDPFAGSGSVAAAVQGGGRRVIAIEADERYCEIAARRLAQDVLAVMPS